MATLGSYDPNNYQEIYDEATGRAAGGAVSGRRCLLPEDSDAYEAAIERVQCRLWRRRAWRQWRNRCVSDGYEPGSTFKLVTLAAALDSGAVTLKQHSFYCGGHENFNGREQDASLLEGRQVTARRRPRRRWATRATSPSATSACTWAARRSIEYFKAFRLSGKDRRGPAGRGVSGLFCAEDKFSVGKLAHLVPPSVRPSVSRLCSWCARLRRSSTAAIC